MDGGGDAGLRDSRHVDGDRLSGGDQASHRRGAVSASDRKADAAHPDRSVGFRAYASHQLQLIHLNPRIQLVFHGKTSLLRSKRGNNLLEAWISSQWIKEWMQTQRAITQIIGDRRDDSELVAGLLFFAGPRVN